MITYWRFVGRDKWVNLQLGALAAIVSSPVIFFCWKRIVRSDQLPDRALNWEDPYRGVESSIGIRVRSQCHFGSRSDSPWSIFGPIPQPPSDWSGGSVVFLSPRTGLAILCDFYLWSSSFDLDPALFMRCEQIPLGARSFSWSIFSIYSVLKMDGANFWNAPSIDHLRDGMFCAIYRFPTHVLENNLFSSRLVKK